MTSTCDLEAVVESAATALEEASAEEVLRWATATFGDQVCLTSSMTDALMVHLASRVKPGIDVLFLDTGYHFAETVGTRDAVSAVYPVNVVNVEPEQTVAEQDAAYGRNLFERDPDRCCSLRKVQPLSAALAPYVAWISGIRRDESSTRQGARVVEWDARRGMVKVNPVARWTQDDMDRYIAEHGVLVNPLVYDDYPSIGCAPCTRQVAPGGDPRAGRWAGFGKTECGIN